MKILPDDATLLCWIDGGVRKTEVAEQYGVTRQAVGQAVQDARARLGRPRAGHGPIGSPRAIAYPRRMNQPTNPFAALALAVLPEQTSGRLARVFDVNQRVAQRWISGDLDVPADVIELLEQQRALLAKSNPGPGIQRAIDDAKTAGLHDEILGAYLSLAYEHLLQRRIR